MLVGARFARPKTACFVYYSQGRARWFGQANPAPTVDDSIGRFSFEHPLTVNRITVTPDFWYAFRQIFPPPPIFYHFPPFYSWLFTTFAPINQQIKHERIYKKYLALSTLFNILSAVLNIFSFSLIVPILSILFQMEKATYTFMPWSSDASIKDIVINNFQYYITELINQYGPSTTLLLLGLFMACMTFLKTGCYFLSSATMIPIRTGIVRDIRVQLYKKLLSLPLGFFSEERKGDIIARMSGDVNEIENSIMSSLDMLLKNPILIISYFTTLIIISWQLTLFTIAIVPIMGWVMGTVGKKLKRGSLIAQGQWSDLMSQLEETLGGLRIIKAFNAEKKMVGLSLQNSLISAVLPTRRLP